MQLADTIWAASELALPLRRDLLAAMAAGVTQQLGTVAAHDLVSTTYALVRLGLPLPPALLDLTLLEAEAEMSRLSLRDLSGLAWALACAGGRPGAAWLARMDAAAVALLEQQPREPAGGRRREAGAGAVGEGEGEGEGEEGAAVGGEADVRVMERGQGGVGVRLEQQSGSMQTSLVVEAACRLVASRPALGPVPSPALPRAVQALLSRPDVLPLVTAPQLLLAVEGLARTGHVGGREAVLQALTAPVMRRSGLPEGGAAGKGGSSGTSAAPRRPLPARLAVPLK